MRLKQIFIFCAVVLCILHAAIAMADLDIYRQISFNMDDVSKFITSAE